MRGEIRGQLSEVGSPHPLSMESSSGHQPCVAHECHQLSHLAGSELLIFKKTLSCGKIYVA